MKWKEKMVNLVGESRVCLHELGDVMNVDGKLVDN